VSIAPAFDVSTVPLAVGGKWILLTDGIVEAQNMSGSQFGESALAEALARSAIEQAEPLQVLEETWRQFCKYGADRDDATALLVTDSTELPPSSIERNIAPDNIADLRSFCEQWTAFAGLDEIEAYQVILACDEIFTNVYKHAYSSKEGPVRCDAKIDLTALIFSITHWGAGLETNIPRPPERSGVGGYGLPFVRRVFNGLEFDTRDGYSTVRLSKRIIPTADTAA
jgi:anti-sigma regulatory factor (Ser/Thr protein kinase)